MTNAEIIAELKNIRRYNYTLAPEEVFYRAIEALLEQRAGRWIKIDTNQYTCDCCHTCFTIDLDDNNITQFSYCPNCGAKMAVSEPVP